MSEPPRLGRALIRWRAQPDRRAELEGDVVELWRARRLAGRPYRLAFWRDVWSVVKPTLPVGDGWLKGVSGMGADFRFAVRLMARHPTYAALIVATLACGIAASTAIFTICDRVLFRPLPYPDPQQIVALPNAGFSFANGRMGVPKSLRTLPVFDGVGIYATGGLNLGNDSSPARVRAAAVSIGFFQAMGVKAERGRTFEDAEDAAAAAVAVLSQTAWRAYFQAAPDIIGRSIRINSRPFLVIGVMPAGFAFPQDSEIWIPVGADNQISGEAFAPSMLARLGRNVTPRDAVAALPKRNDGRPPIVEPLQQQLSTRVRPTLLFLGAISGLLLLATCANVAGLLLSRVSARSREMSVRASLGASPARLARQLTVECGVLTLAGAIAGFAAALWLVRAFSMAAPTFVSDVDLVSIDLRFFVVAAGIALLAAGLFALAPAVAVFRGSSSAGATRTVTRRTGWLADGLLAGQVAAALVLLAATTAALGVMLRLTRVEIGFHNERAVLFELTLPASRYEGAGVVDFVERLEMRVRAVPGVERVGATNRAPGSVTIGAGAAISDADAPPPESPQPSDGAVSPFATRLAASPDYFRAMGIRLVAGRMFTADDRAGAPSVAIINVTAARQLWKDPANAVGRRLRVGFSPRTPTLLEVVGVVEDVRLASVTREPGRQLYTPIAQRPPFGLVTVAVGVGAGNAAGTLEAVRQALKEVDPELPAHNVTFVRDLMARYLASERLTLALSSGFSMLALMLCAVGLYGALSQLVAERTREIGIRMALGADRRAVRGQVMWQSLRVAIAGVVIGALASGVASRAIAHFVPALDAPRWLAIAANGGVLLAVAALAAWAPARRASAVDPLRALRVD